MKRWMVLGLALIPAMGGAEVFIDLYGGKSHTTSGEVTGKYKEQGFLLSQEKGDFDDSESGIGGIRVGYWFQNTSWLGVALDVSYFDADAEDSSIEIDVLPISALLMFRYPLLVSEDFPYGRFYPYVGVGLTFASVDITSKYDDWLYDTDDYYDYYGYDDDGAGYGYGTDFRAGLDFQITRNVGLFIEYRYLSLEIEHIEDENEYGWWRQSLDYDGDLQAQFVLGGVSFHF